MGEAIAAGSQPARRLGEGFVLRVFVVFAALAMLSVAISFGGKWLGKSIALAGHTEDTSLKEVVIGNNVLVAPANAIRFEHERRSGVAASLHLYLRWPELGGYSAETRDDFNHAGGSRNILFVSFEPRMMSRDMSGRYEPIYKSLIAFPGQPGPAGLTVHAFTEASGYVNETLVVGEEPGRPPFVARCLSGAVAKDSLADCERDIAAGDELTLVYRFPSSLLPEWRRLDAAMNAYAKQTLRTGK